MVHGTAVQESPQRRRRDPTIQTLSDKSWDSTEEVLGHCSLGTVLEQYSLGTVLGQCSLGTVWGRCSLGTVLDQSSLGTTQSWDSGLGTLVLGQWSWVSGLETLVLGQ